MVVAVGRWSLAQVRFYVLDIKIKRLGAYSGILIRQFNRVQQLSMSSHFSCT